MMTLESTVQVADFPWLQNIKDEEVEFIVILDRSSSMNGQPWKQVQDSMVKMLELTRVSSADGKGRIFMRRLLQ